MSTHDDPSNFPSFQTTALVATAAVIALNIAVHMYTHLTHALVIVMGTDL